MTNNKMKKSSKVCKPTAPLHPWYYVSGRKDLTEKNISSRREREEQQHQKCVDHNKYLVKCDNDLRLFHRWNDNKTLVKYSDKKHSNEPPFDVIEPKVDSNNIRRNKQIDKKYIESNKKFSQIMLQFNKLIEEYKELKKSQNILIFQLNELQKIKISIDEKKEFCELKSKRLFYVRFGREKLRQKVFQICDQLICYKIAVQSLQDLSVTEGVFNSEELNQLSEVNDRAIKILDMYIQLNQNRDTEFQLMFHEEGEQRWITQELEWQQEYQVWNTLMEKLIDSYKAILKENLEHILSAQQTSLQQREQHLNELSLFASELKRDPRLSSILTQDINTFLTNSN